MRDLVLRMIAMTSAVVAIMLCILAYLMDVPYKWVYVLIAISQAVIVVMIDMEE